MISNRRLNTLLNIALILVIGFAYLFEFKFESWTQAKSLEKEIEQNQYRVRRERELFLETALQMEKLLALYQSCDEQFLAHLYNSRLNRISITNVFVLASNGAVCSEYKKFEINYDIDLNRKRLQMIKIDTGVAMIFKSPTKDTALVFEMSFREMWGGSRAYSNPNVMLEYWLNRQFLVGLGQESYYLNERNKEGFEELLVPFDEALPQSDSLLDLRIFIKESFDITLSMMAYLRLLLFSLVAVLVWRYYRQALVKNMRYQLLSGIHNNEFKSHFQPIIDMRKGEWVGAEALIRWYRDEKIHKYPDEFIPYAERKNLSFAFTKACINDANNVLANVPSNLPFFISINIAPNDLNKSSIDYITKQSIRPKVNHRFELEITERGISEGKLKQTSQFIEALHQAGFCISLDDFGTGQSGLSYIKAMHFDKLKIDKNYVQAINTDSIDELILNTIIELAKNLKVGIIAEGVETQEQVDWLLDKGIYLAQGWHFERDYPIDEFISKLKSKHE